MKIEKSDSMFACNLYSGKVNQHKSYGLHMFILTLWFFAHFKLWANCWEIKTVKLFMCIMFSVLLVAIFISCWKKILIGTVYVLTVSTVSIWVFLLTLVKFWDNSSNSQKRKDVTIGTIVRNHCLVPGDTRTVVVKGHHMSYQTELNVPYTLKFNKVCNPVGSSRKNSVQFLWGSSRL